MDDWIESRVFPGAYPPTLGEMMPIFEPNDFSIMDVENLGLHYARTLTHWLQRYELNFDTVRESSTRPSPAPGVCTWPEFRIHHRWAATVPGPVPTAGIKRPAGNPESSVCGRTMIEHEVIVVGGGPAGAAAAWANRGVDLDCRVRDAPRFADFVRSVTDLSRSD